MTVAPGLPSSARTKDRTGERYGRLVAVRVAEFRNSGSKRAAYWLCRCDCGNEKVVASQSLATGNTVSCGCTRRNDRRRDVGLPWNVPDLRGCEFGLWTVLGYAEGGRWLVRCACGTEKHVSGESLQKGASKSCGKHKQIQDLTGQRFGFWTVISQAPSKRCSSRTYTMWNVRCDCGTEAVHQGGNLKSRSTTSCGCRFARVPGEAALNDLFGHYRGGARRRGLEFSLDREIFRELIGKDCEYCGMPPSLLTSHGRRLKTPIVYNGIDRIDSNIGYVDGNCVPCCKRCNWAKLDMPLREFEAWIDRLISHRRKRHQKSDPNQLSLLHPTSHFDPLAA